MQKECPVCLKMFYVNRFMYEKRRTCGQDCRRLYSELVKRRFNFRGWHVSTQGYKMIFVGKNHHLANAAGYAFEHRIVAEKMIGRRLTPNEQVHHIDENKLNNSEDNLVVCPDAASHRAFHRKKTKVSDETILCQCGCGETLNKYDERGYERRFMVGHSQHKKPIIGKLLKLFNEDELKIKDIFVALSEHKEMSIRSALHQLVKTKKLIKCHPMTYKLNS